MRVFFRISRFAAGVIFIIFLISRRLNFFQIVQEDNFFQLALLHVAAVVF